MITLFLISEFSQPALRLNREQSYVSIRLPIHMDFLLQLLNARIVRCGDHLFLSKAPKNVADCLLLCLGQKEVVTATHNACIQELLQDFPISSRFNSWRRSLYSTYV